MKIKGMAFLLLVLLASCKKNVEQKIMRVGYFPNITHAQALIGISQGKFQEALGNDVLLEAKLFNAGPSAVEALFAGAIDLAYLGPTPAINAYLKSQGDFKIIAGAASGGASLVIRNDLKINSVQDFKDKKIATPQLGNTQDVSARTWFRQNNLILKEKGGSLQIFPIANADQLSLFMKKELDGAWTIEPWVSRLVEEADGKVFMDERQIWKTITGGKFSTALLLVNVEFMKNNPDLVKKWVQTHAEITDWIRSQPDEAKKIINEEIKKHTGKPLSPKVLDRAFANVEFTVDPIPESIVHQARWAYEQGFLGKQSPDVSQIVDDSIPDEVMKGD